MSEALEVQLVKAVETIRNQAMLRSPAQTQRAIEDKIGKLLEPMRAFIRCQMQLAWMRQDFRTADAAADLLGEERPSEHEGEA